MPRSAAKVPRSGSQVPTDAAAERTESPLGAGEMPRARESGPARDGVGWHAAPFEAGHELSVKHGAYSQRFVSPLAQRITEYHLAMASEPGSRSGHLLRPECRDALDDYAEVYATVLLLRANVDEHGQFDAEGAERPPFRSLDRWQSMLLNARIRCGLDALSNAQIRKMDRDLAVDVTADRALVNLRGRFGGAEDSEADEALG